MPAFLVALMVVVLVVLALTVVLLLTRTMRKETAAVPRARREKTEPTAPHPPRTEDD